MTGKGEKRENIVAVAAAAAVGVKLSRLFLAAFLLAFGCL